MPAIIFDSARHGLRPLGVPPAQAAELLSCTREMIYRLMTRGELESFVVGRSRRVTTASIEAFVARHMAGQS
jgi:excisionase family DNA binding protein